MRILLSGPGTGKTTKIKGLIDSEFSTAERIVVLSFTNFTVKGLEKKFETYSNVECWTLHKFALVLNPHKGKYILTNGEDKELAKIAAMLEVEEKQLYDILGCITFQGMITECAEFLKTNPKHASEIFGNADLLIVDEYQDFNQSEQIIIDELAKVAAETIILGDDDQSIYGFKDADPDRIIAIHSDESVVKIPHEHKCWRCPDEIVDRAGTMILKNKKRVAKDWEKTGQPGSVTFEQLGSVAETDDKIVKTVGSLKGEKPECTILILSPFNALTKELQSKLEKEGQNVVNCFPNKIETETLQKIWWMNVIFTETINPFVVMLLRKVQGAKKDQSRDLIKLIVETGLSRDEIVKTIVDEKLLPAPFRGYLENAPSLDDFFNSHPEYALFNEFVDRTNQAGSIRKIGSSINPTKELIEGAINIMSIHKSKGLEADYVFICGLVKGIVPNDTRGLDTIEAQRRLLFVAMTRALKGLYLYSTVEWESGMLMANFADRKQFAFKSRTVCVGKTSSFVAEMEN